MQNAKNRTNIKFLLFMCWLVYSSSYLGKVNFSASKLSLMTHFAVNEAEIGLVGTFFFFAYGIFMVINGVFCKKYNIKYVIFTALVVSSVINLSIPFIPKSAFGVIKFLWMINGAVLSMLWPTLIRLLSETLPKDKMPTASKVMGTTVATGTLLIYGLSALFAEIKAFQFSFFVPAIIVPTVAVLWLLFYKRFTDIDSEDEPLPLTETTDKKAKTKLPSGILTVIVCFALFAVVTNLVKDGMTGWVPKILKDSYGLPDSVSILMTLALPLMGIIANFFTVWIAGKMKNLVLLDGIFFVVGGVMVLGITLLLSTNLVVLTFIMMMVVSLIASGSNNIITSIFPLSMKGKGNSGLIAGVLNGFCYLGSTISDYGLGAIKVATGNWLSVFYVLLGGCGIVVLTAAIYSVINGLKKNKVE
ncbi:MAG: MFS transporter [Clostridia bacterium]|nr:MFS transporter [Clostridia bacterium]